LDSSRRSTSPVRCMISRCGMEAKAGVRSQVVRIVRCVVENR
jgi:hypothetical protein